jgi:hypothetical protein
MFLSLAKIYGLHALFRPSCPEGRREGSMRLNRDNHNPHYCQVGKPPPARNLFLVLGYVLRAEFSISKTHFCESLNGVKRRQAGAG